MVVNELNQIVKKYNMGTSLSKSKAVAFCGRSIKRVELETEGKIIEQVSGFTYLGYLI
jgi:hypothetical protein